MSLRKKIAHRMETPTSGMEIMRLLHNKVKIVQYLELYAYKDIDELLYPYGAVVLLVNTADNFGHWTAVFRYPSSKTIEVFDSYGCFVDHEFDWISKAFRREVGMDPYLYKLLLKYPYDIEYNNDKCQAESPYVNTCGLWCVTRLRNKDINIDEFVHYYRDLPLRDGVSPDVLISSLYL